MKSFACQTLRFFLVAVFIFILIVLILISLDVCYILFEKKLDYTIRINVPDSLTYSTIDTSGRHPRAGYYRADYELINDDFKYAIPSHKIHIRIYIDNNLVDEKMIPQLEAIPPANTHVKPPFKHSEGHCPLIPICFLDPGAHKITVEGTQYSGLFFLLGPPKNHVEVTHDFIVHRDPSLPMPVLFLSDEPRGEEKKQKPEKNK